MPEPLSINSPMKCKSVKMNKNNFWLLELIYGDAANDRTATFQIPANVTFKPIK
jgi:hypothetical protein